MSKRNGVTYIKSADVVAKQEDKAEKKATADVKKPDPVNAKEIVEKNTKAEVQTKPEVTKENVDSGVKKLEEIDKPIK